MREVLLSLLPRFLLLRCAVRFELLFPLQRGPLRNGEPTNRDVSGSGFRGFLFLLASPLCFWLFRCHRESCPKSRVDTLWLERLRVERQCTGLESDGISRPR